MTSVYLTLSGLWEYRERPCAPSILEWSGGEAQGKMTRCWDAGDEGDKRKARHVLRVQELLRTVPGDFTQSPL